LVVQFQSYHVTYFHLVNFAGNMFDHALELLYTQLASQKSSKNSSEDNILDEDDENDDGEDEEDPENPMSAVTYTPKVLESALLFSVAGKKAYKALCQTVKLPPYSDIVKWKRIIRSNPQYYKKLFPKLRAKFFKKRVPEAGESSTSGNTEFISMNTLNGDPIPIVKNETEKTVSKEEAESLYNKLMSAKDKFDVLLSEDSSRYHNNCTKLIKEHESRLNILMSDKVIDIDFDLDASMFIEEIKKLEKPNVSMGDTDADVWEDEHEMVPEVITTEELQSFDNPNHPSVATTIDSVIRNSIRDQVNFGEDPHNTAPLFVAEDNSQDQIIIQAGTEQMIPVTSSSFLVTTSNQNMVQTIHHQPLTVAPHQEEFIALAEEEDTEPQPDMPRIF